MVQLLAEPFIHLYTTSTPHDSLVCIDQLSQLVGPRDAPLLQVYLEHTRLSILQPQQTHAAQYNLKLSACGEQPTNNKALGFPDIQVWSRHEH